MTDDEICGPDRFVCTGGSEFWKPELLWKIEHLFSVKGGEPTDFYLSMMRIGGVIFAVIAVIMAISFL